jgi:hypothetical protein
MHWDSLFSESFLNPCGPQGSSTPVLSFSTTPTPRSRLGTQYSCTWISVCQPPMVFLVENVAIQHHPGNDVESYLFPTIHCPSFIQVSLQHHVWRVHATHKPVVGCEGFRFYLWIATTSSLYILLLNCGMAREKNDMIFFCLFLLAENTWKKGTKCAIHFLPNCMQICSWTAMVSFLFLLTVPVM